VARLAFKDVSLVGLVGDVDAGHTRYTVRNSLFYAPQFCGSLHRDLGADLRGDPAMLSSMLAQRPITLVFIMISSCSYSTNDLVLI